jgi:23S rRNA (pseudouridine1915-N3)-methyltransferase
MKLRVAWVAPKSRSKQPAYDNLTQEYTQRIARYQAIEASALPSEAALLKLTDREAARTRPVLVLLDSLGTQMTSEELAAFIARQQSADVQQLIFAIGPAHGWSKEARTAASQLLSLGRLTLPHELARVVLLEQLYRAFTILKGHPYHSGH